MGNSGSGKSNTIAHILQNILHKNDYSAYGSKIILFDVNGEYKNAFSNENFEQSNNISDKIEVKYYQPNLRGESEGYESFFLPHFLLNLDEWCAFLIATEATQRPFWDKVLQESYRFYALAQHESIEFKKMGHYLIYRICNIVFNILSQADSDTSRMTTVTGLIGGIRSLIEKDKRLQEAALKELCEINPFTIDSVLEELQEATKIYYGSNSQELKTTVESVHQKLKQEDIESVLNQKLNPGSYYSYEFLKIAAELCLIEEDSHGNKNIRNWTSTMITRLDYFLDNPDCAFMRRSATTYRNAEEYMKNTFSIGNDTDKDQLIIIDTSGLPADALETLTSVIARLLFDHRKKADARTKKPIHLILDEAHRYVKKDNNYKIKENIFEKIAREGRKYSYYLLISSQRPSELSETVLSQCGNYIVHRIQNEVDMNYVKAIMPFFSQDFVMRIKQAVPGEAMVFGDCVPMPLHIKITQANPEPSSKNCDISSEWFRDKLIPNAEDPFKDV